MKKFKYIFRCDAGNIPEIGTGHLTRCLLIAKKLIEENLCEKDEICFATRKNKEFSAGFQKIKFSQFATINTEDICLVPNTKMEGNILSEYCNGLIVLDRLRTEKLFIKNLKKRGNKVITFDDQGYGALEADIAINAILDPVENSPTILTGIEYLVIDDSYRFKKKVFHRQYSKNKFKIFASFGGYDHLGFVRKFLKMIEKHICDGSKNFEFNIIGGYDCLKDKENLATIKELNKNIHNDIFYFSKPTNFYEILNQSDLAIVNGGLTLFDAVARSIPALGLPQYEHQFKTLTKFEEQGLVLKVSNKFHFTDQQLYKKFQILVNDKNLRNQIKRNCKGKVDGKGLNKIVSLLDKQLKI